MHRGSKVGLISCSNGLEPESGEKKIKELIDTLKNLGLEPVKADCIFRNPDRAGVPARERAAQLMEFYENPEIEVIFDVSGGDIANEVLPYLDYEVIRSSGKWFYGYSDLTTILNAIYAKTGKPSVLYQIRNLTGEDRENQQERFSQMLWEGTEEFFTFPCRYLRGSETDGTLVGGNIRCLLKLAGTEYWPDMQDKILLLESYGGSEVQMRTYLAQLSQLGVFDQVKAILLGTFTKMEAEGVTPTMEEMVCEIAGPTLPVIKTDRIGHGANSSAVVIGAYTCLQNIRDEHRPMVDVSQ